MDNIGLIINITSDNVVSIVNSPTVSASLMLLVITDVVMLCLLIPAYFIMRLSETKI